MVADQQAPPPSATSLPESADYWTERSAPASEGIVDHINCPPILKNTPPSLTRTRLETGGSLMRNTSQTAHYSSCVSRLLTMVVVRWGSKEADASRADAVESAACSKSNKRSISSIRCCGGFISMSARCGMRKMSNPLVVQVRDSMT